MKGPIAGSIDQYISSFPPAVQKMLRQMRTTIAKAAPDAVEAIKYAIPTFVFHGNLVHFAAYSNHVGFYPAPSGLKAFQNELAPYKSSKGAVQFPLDEPLPLDTISKIVKFRVNETLANKKIKELTEKTVKSRTK
jgi:uncharacterized protein YdhG (YjbR/CyaY superfamily)